MPTLFIPHGGGPCFFMAPGEGFPAGLWDNMAAYLRAIPETLPARPKSLLVISGHWAESPLQIYSPLQSTLLYDYYGFPPHTYQIQYPAPGDPALAARVSALLANAGFAPSVDATRGFDHGVFIPLKVAFPAADIPIVQLSLRADYDPAAHFAIGQALAPLREEGVLIVGSGMSYHNLRMFASPAGDAIAAEFDAWLHAAVTEPDPSARQTRLTNWISAPGARACHPQEEHLVPLFVAAGAAGSAAAVRDYNDRVWGKAVAAFRFG